MALSKSQQLSTLLRGLDVLSYINLIGPRTVGQVTQTMGLSRGTAHRILETLAAGGFLARDVHDGSYALTPQVQRLSSGYGADSQLIEVARPMILEFSRQNGWPCSLATPLGANMIIRATSEYYSPLNLTRLPAGFTYPILQASAGIAYLAFCSPERRAQILSFIRKSEADKYRDTEQEKTLPALLEKVRTQGFCSLDSPGFAEGGLGVTFSIGSVLVGGLVMRFMKSAVPTSRLRTHFAPLLKDLSMRINTACVAAGVIYHF